MRGNRVRIVADRQAALGDVVEVHSPSRNGVDLLGVTVEYYPPRPLPSA